MLSTDYCSGFRAVSLVFVLLFLGCGEAVDPGDDNNDTEPTPYHLLFSAGEDSSSLEIFTVSSESAEMQKHTNASDFSAYQPRWYPDGSAILYTTLANNSYSIIGQSLSSGETTPFFSAPEEPFYDNISQNNEMTYRIEDQINQRIENQLLNLTEQAGYQVNLPTSYVDPLFMTWSPNAENILWRTTRFTSASEDNQLVLTDRNGQVLQQELFNADVQELNVLDVEYLDDDNQLMLRIEEPDGERLYTRPTSGGDLTALTDSSGMYDIEWDWSSDEKWLAYSYRKDSSRYRMYLQNAEGDSLQQIQPESTSAHTPRWSPDDRQIAFVGANADSADLYLYDTEADSLSRLTDFNARYLFLEDWEPDQNTKRN